MTNTAALALDNIRYLQQGIELLRRIDEKAYTRNDPRLYRSGIGGHIRHNIDHCRSFLDGLVNGKIDYDARERDPRIEIDREYAVEQLGAAIQQLSRITEADIGRTITVKMDCGAENEKTATWCQSTMGRELQFLLSHTVHHYALVAMILRFQGLEPGEEFGVAPSTLRYTHQNLQCAPLPG